MQVEVRNVGKEKFIALQKRLAWKVNEVKQIDVVLKKRRRNPFFEVTEIKYVQIFISG